MASQDPPVTVLVVDDDPELRAALARALRLEGYRVGTAPNGAQALAALPELRPDVVVLDVMMPVVGGVEVCRRMRAAGDRTPILVLTARDAVGDRVVGLDAGADDYLVKPFALAELQARLRALVRRSKDPEAGAEPLRCADLTLDPETRRARRGDRSIELTRTEYVLLELLLRNAGRVLTREVIVDRVWGYELPASNSLEVFIGYLRRKTEAGGEPRLIHTVRGVGYQAREAW
ncbi:MAG: response regulator transcription factor [Actinobacteria bacterium]|nr:response regulator transcription factor [Actinomycetota bacterium]MBI3686502.1 response regulator transcription factor [Actinomycetota bacterium]